MLKMHRNSIALMLFISMLQPLKAQDETATDPDAVAATIGNWAIKIADVDRRLNTTLKGRQINERLRPLLRAETLDRMIGQQLITDYLVAEKFAVGDSDVQIRSEQIKSQLSSVEKPLKDYLAKIGLETEEDLLRELKFKMSWEKYLNRQLADANLQKHFERNRRELDDTRLRISQILLKPEPDATSYDKVFARADKISRQLADSSLSWNDAVKQFSVAPSKQELGDIGWIERRKPMPETFSKVAFLLEKDQVSSPFQTRIGVHIIKCTEIETGKTTFDEARDRVRHHATQFLFGWICDRQRSAANIKYTGRCAHLDPESRKLVLPKM